MEEDVEDFCLSTSWKAALYISSTSFDVIRRCRVAFNTILNTNFGTIQKEVDDL